MLLYMPGDSGLQVNHLTVCLFLLGADVVRPIVKKGGFHVGEVVSGLPVLQC